MRLACIDVDKCDQALKEKYSPNAIPKILGFKKGSQVHYYIGPMMMDFQVDDFVKKVV